MVPDFCIKDNKGISSIIYIFWSEDDVVSFNLHPGFKKSEAFSFVVELYKAEAVCFSVLPGLGDDLETEGRGGDLVSDLFFQFFFGDALRNPWDEQGVGGLGSKA
jgi:hypothetical protein